VKFEQLDMYFLDAILYKNNFVENFTTNGWPLAYGKTESYATFKVLKQLFFKKILIYLDFVNFAKKSNFFKLRLTGLKERITRYLDKPFHTAENSLSLDSKPDATFPLDIAFNLQPILKSFLVNESIRINSRFLDPRDFNKIHSGTMINPVNFCYLIYTHSKNTTFWKFLIEQALHCLPFSCQKIFLLSEESNKTINFFNQYKDNRIELLTYRKEDKHKARIEKALLEASKSFEMVYFTHDNMPLFDKVDQVYLNSLLHFLRNSDENFIQLLDINSMTKNEEHKFFPGLINKSVGLSFWNAPLLINVQIVKNFLSNFDDDLNQFYESLNNYSVVKNNIRAVESISKNKYFPHILKPTLEANFQIGKWDTEMVALCKKYGLNIGLIERNND